MNTNQVSAEHRISVTRGPASPQRPASAEAGSEGGNDGSLSGRIRVDTAAEAKPPSEQKALCKVGRTDICIGPSELERS